MGLACRHAMRLGWLVLVLACKTPGIVASTSSPRDPALESVPRHHVEQPVAGLVDPPLVPDVTYPPQVPATRWLPRAPSLEPHADVARIYGTTRPWTELCVARGQPRGVDAEEASDYVRAWCDARTGDARARERIAALRDARSPAIAEAARWDAVDLAAEFAPDVATAMRQAGDSEALAATYVELGRIDEARAVLEVLGRRSRPSCRQIAVAISISMRVDVDQLRVLVATGDPLCARLHQELACPLVTGTWPRIPCRRAHCALSQVAQARGDCASLLHERPELAPILIRDGLVVRWPLHEATSAGWLAIARAALPTLALEEGLALVSAALQNAARVMR